LLIYIHVLDLSQYNLKVKDMIKPLQKLEIDTTFHRLKDSILTIAPELGKSNADTEYARSLFSSQSGTVHQIFDYNKSGMVFNQACFFKNLYRCIAVLIEHRHSLMMEVPICDLGSGCGAFTLAWLAVMGEPKHGITLCDECEPQLNLARRLLSGIGFKSFATKLIRVEISEVFRDYFCLSSFFFCEQDFTVNQHFDQLRPKALIIDTSDTIDTILRCLGDSQIYSVTNLTLTPNQSVSKIVAEVSYSAHVLRLH
jgi:hypothetical protein